MAKATISSPTKIEMVPPEGGWGYAVMLGVSVIFTVTLLPVSMFGAVFGTFVRDLGDEIGATTLINGVFNTTLFLAGLPANHLLQKYTYRKVGLLGAFLFFTGSFATIFAQNLFHMVIAYGVLQGCGFGLSISAAFSAFHEYFVEKQNVMMSVSQTIIGAMGMLWPSFTSMLMKRYGFRGTAAVFSALSLHLFLSASAFQPAKWHYKRKNANTESEMFVYETNAVADDTEDKIRMEIDQLMERSLQDVAKSSEESLGKWQSVVKSFDLVLFKDPFYVNLAVGTGMSMTSDVLFISIMPLVLDIYELDHTLMLTIFFSADLAGRAFLSVFNAFFRVWNRYVVFTGSVLSTVFRIAFTLNYSFWWTTMTIAVLGFLRCCIQTTFPLVFAEKYGPRFTTAFSLAMVVCGIIVFTVGVLSGWVKDLTKSDFMVVHLLTLVYSLCAVPWALEFLLIKMKRNKEI